MNSRRLFFVLCIVLVLLISGAIAGTFFGNSMLKKKSENIVKLKMESTALDEQQRSLIQAKKDIKNYQELEQIAKAIVPQEKDQARTVREIIQIAEENNVPISSITFPASTLGQAQPRTAAPPAAEGNGGTAASQPQAAATQATQVVPVEGIPGVYQLAISVQSVNTSPVRYQDMLNFLTDLQKNRRTSHVTNLSVAPTTNNRNLVTFSLVINAYIKP